MDTVAEWDAARAELKAKHFEAAAEHLLVVIEEDDEDADAYCYLGACYGQLGRYVESEFYLSKACELRPDMAQAHYNLGRCFQARKRIEMAIRCYENALRADPDYGPARNALKELHAVLSPDVRGAEDEEEQVDETEQETHSTSD